MQSWYQVLGLVGFILVAWILYRGIKGRPAQFSRENLMKSFSSMGVLSLILIGFVTLLVMLLKTS